MVAASKQTFHHPLCSSNFIGRFSKKLYLHTVFDAFFRYSTGFYTRGLTENSLKTGKLLKKSRKADFYLYFRNVLPK